MFEQLIQIDHQLFDWINQGLSNSLFDAIMPIIRNKKTWIPLYLLVAFFLIRKNKKEGIVFILLGIASVVLADAVSSHLLKPYFARIRPCMLENFSKHTFLLLDRCSGAFSFPSSHAANHFALASFLALSIKNMKPVLRLTLLFWAGLIGFAQIYVGVHFPADVLAGSFLGVLTGLACHLIWKWIDMKRSY